MKAVSLFSGAGGMDVGFHQAGFEIIWANDFDKDACATYRINHGEQIHLGDINNFMADLEQLAATDEITCLFGGPPCQGFSVAGKMDAHDPRSKLIWSFMDAVRLTKPQAFVMENVKALATLDKFREIRECLFKTAHQLGYDVDLVVLNAKDFGVPQARERMFLIGFKDQPNHFRRTIEEEREATPKLRDVLLSVGKIGTASNQRVCNAKITAATSPVLRRSPYAGMLFNGQGRPLNLEGHAATLPASMGGNRTPIIDNEALYENKPSWIEEYHDHLMKGGQPLAPASVPSRLRRLTVDEAIALQTFPTTYQFVGPQSSVFKQIGNAVPCKLAYAVATAVAKLLTEEKPSIKWKKSIKSMQFELL